MRIFNPPNLSSATELVYDTETDGLDWKKNKVVGYVLTWGPRPDETAYYPVRHEGGGNYNPAEVESWIKSLADNPNILWTGHHMKFDMHMSANHGIIFKGPVNCTQVNAALIDEEQGKYSLDACAKKYGVTEKKGDALYEHMAKLFGGEPNRKQMGNFWKLRGDDPVGLDYAVGDGTSTWEVWEYQKNRLKFDVTGSDVDLMRVWAVECRVLKTLFRMERRGVKVDMERYEFVKHKVEDDIAKLREQFHPDFKPLSMPQVHKILIDNGITEGWKETATGKPSLTAEFLSTVPIGQQIIKLRKLENLIASFIDGQISRHLHNGRVFTTFNQLKMDEYGTVTGRLSSSDPNLQQVPKRDKELAPLFRSIFVPDDGFYWSANDYKQQEFVVFAHYSNSTMLIDGYNQTPVIDMHQRCAELLNVERDPTAKRINLGKLYWMGIPKLARSLKISEDEAKRLSNIWDSQLPEASAFRYAAKKRAENKGYVRSFLGRRRRYNGRELTYQAANAIIQMSSADVTKLKMVEIDEYFEKTGNQAQMLLQVHDELDWQVPIDRRELDECALKIMTDFAPGQMIELRAKLGVDHSEGENWGKATFGEKK